MAARPPSGAFLCLGQTPPVACGDSPLKEGQRLIFGDMAIYSTCKNNTFNGMPLPDIWVLHENGTTQPLARFGYHDFKYRLGSPR